MNHSSVYKLLDRLTNSYYKKCDIDDVLDCVTDDIVWIGTEKNDSATGKEELKKVLKKDFDFLPDGFDVEINEPVIKELSDSIVLANLSGNQKDEKDKYLFRGSAICEKKEGKWLISSLHVSLPNTELEKDTLAKKLVEKSKQEKLLMTSIPGGVAIYRIKKDGKVGTDYVSESLAKMCGYSADDFLAYLREDSIINLVPEDVPAVRKAVEKCLATGDPMSIMYHIYKKNRDVIYIRLDARIISTEELLDDDFAVVYAVHTIVSDESQKIIADQQRLRELIDQVPTGIGIFEVNGDKISQIYMNNSFYEMLGTTRHDREKFFGENAILAAHPDDVEIILGTIKKLFSGENSANISYRLKLDEDKWFWLNLSVSVVERRENYLKIYLAFSDYNEIKRAEIELENGRVTLETALQSAKVITWRYNYKTKQITDSLTLGEKFGLPKVVDNVPTSILEQCFIAEESEKEFLDMFKDIEAERPVTVDTKSNIKGDKGFYWYKQIYTPTYDSKGNYIDSIGVAIDITEQKEREQRYKEQLRLSRIAAQDALATGTFNVTTNTVSEIETRYEYFANILNSGTVDEVLSEIKSHIGEELEDDGTHMLSNCEELIRCFKIGKHHFEMRHRLDDDSRWFQSTMDVIDNPYSGEIESIIMVRDITETVQAELVVNQLMKVDYKSILIIDIRTGSTVPFKHNNKDENLEEIMELQKETGDTEAGLADYFRKYAVPGTTERVIEENSLDYIINQLKDKLYYESIYTLIQDGRKKQYRTLYSYLAKDKNIILSAVQDTTNLYEQEERQKTELSKALKEAKDASLAKTDFMSRMSHDMRTPMNAIIGLTALTIDDADKPEIVCENMSKMRQASNFMLGLVNDILDMAKIEDGSVVFNMEPYSYSDFLMNMKTMFLPQCQEKNINIKFVEAKLNPTGLTDKIRINQIFFNIFSNAVKYTPVGGKIECFVENVHKEGNRIFGEYVIKDNGIGMSEDFQKHLFEKFRQEDNSVTPELQGSGLGLSITKQLVELMGGQIKVISEKGKGTTVKVGLSFELVSKVSVEKQKAEIVGEGEKTLEGKCVLLVEDHPLNAQIARRLLEKENMVVTHGENGRIGYEIFEASSEGTFDVILMDIRMPEMSGFEATKKIRELKREDAKNIPIIAMSANAYPEDIRKGLDSGMTDYLTKPVEPEKLYEMLLKTLLL